jgi:hypothetical protein
MYIRLLLFVLSWIQTYPSMSADEKQNEKRNPAQTPPSTSQETMATDRAFRGFGIILSMLLAYLLIRSGVLRAAASPTPTSPFGLSVINAANIDYIGVFVDEVTSQEFDLYDSRSDKSEPAISAYYQNIRAANVTLNLNKRSWYNCESYPEPSLQRVCCNSAHGLGRGAVSIGQAALGNFIASEISEATSGGRDNQSPRSVCHTIDGDNVCTTWANYNSNNLPSGASADMGDYSAKCAKEGGSSEFKATDSSGGVIFVCVSNRATGCSSSIG